MDNFDMKLKSIYDLGMTDWVMIFPKPDSAVESKRLLVGLVG
jgi:hypothetical protein